MDKMKKCALYGLFLLNNYSQGTRCHPKGKSWTLTLIIKIVIFPIWEGTKLDEVINRQITEGEFKFILTLGL